MKNKINSLEIFIDMVIDSAADQIDLERILSLLEDKVNKVDNQITALEENEEY